MRELALPMLAINVFNVLTTHENERASAAQRGLMHGGRSDRPSGRTGRWCVLLVRKYGSIGAAVKRFCKNSTDVSTSR